MGGRVVSVRWHGKKIELHGTDTHKFVLFYAFQCKDDFSLLSQYNKILYWQLMYESSIFGHESM